ncbi:MAG: ribonuclease P [Halobacteriales archaeon]|nr:ribonuclease P [Halobacteriales archaeon]
MRRDKAEERRIARERIARLLSLAQERARAGDLPKADRYAHLARRVGQKYVVRLGRTERLQVCRGCEAYLLPGKTSRVRTTEGKVSVTCLRCGRIARHGYLREQRARRAGNAPRG